jgi:hypothetical protein
VIAAEGLPAQLATRVLGVSESGYYEWRGRPPSARAMRHAWLIEQIQAIHLASRRVHAELALGLGITVRHGAVEMLMNRAGSRACPVPAGPGPKHRTLPGVTWCTASSPAHSLTSCGSATSPSGPPGKARSTAPSSSTRRRRHSSLGMLTPIEYELRATAAGPVA